MNIREFLTARLDEEEATARAAAETSHSEHWRSSEHGLFGTDDVSNNPGAFIQDAYGYFPEEIGAHIARWDPARVLAEIAVKRSALKRHGRCGTGVGYCDDGGHGIEPDEGSGGCNDLLDLAAPYADHPDFDPAWSVEDRNEH